jgi:hypothetical protein
MRHTPVLFVDDYAIVTLRVGTSGYALKHATGEGCITAMQEILPGVDLR